MLGVKQRCTGMDMSVFFPGDDDVESLWYETQGQVAIAICQGCPARKACFEFALEDPDSIANGVYGGTTPEDRARYLEAVSLRSGHGTSRDTGADQG